MNQSAQDNGFDEALWRPIEPSRLYFLDALQRLKDAAPRARPVLAESALLPLREGDPLPNIFPFARLNVVLSGRIAYTISRGGRRKTVVLTPGRAIYWPPHAMTLYWWDEPCLLLGAVFYGAQTRYLMIDFPGGAPPATRTPLAYHTQHALEASGVHLLESLNNLCNAPQPNGASARERADVAAELWPGLLSLCRLHLRADQTPGPAPDKAFETWSGVQQFLRDNYTRPLARDEVARALDLHPNYVSQLCRRYTGGSYQHLLEELRLERARFLLRNTGFTLERIATECGFSSANYFIAVFRRVNGLTPTQFRNQ